MTTMGDALRETFAGYEGSSKDKALRQLALLYAEEIDTEAADITVLGPRLLQALDHLLLTPKSRRMTAKAGTESNDPKRGANPLDELKRKRAARVDDPEDLHSPAS